jgi:micrococcal nuclease
MARQRSMWRRAVLVGLLSILALAPAQAQRPADLVDKRFAARVVGVTDGDTVTVLVPPRRQVRVRLHGIDTPEAGEPFSTQARNFTRVLMFSKDVTIRGVDVDRYDRLVARIVVEGADVSEALLAAGLACHYRRYSDDPLLEAAEQAARKAGRGFWAAGAQRPACVAREAPSAAATASRSSSAAGFIGNVRSRVFHAPTCRNATCDNCTRRFATRQEAEAAGFRPAGDCLR